ncbi:MAG: FmdB family zinc ribbon protein [Candidatus Aminicenantaceae bacterium]
MPIYEYKCPKCNKTFEMLQKANDLPLKKCPECGGKLKKIISPPAIQFKGSGWYITDYSRKNKPEKEDGGKNQKKEANDSIKKEKESSTPSHK